MESSDTGWGKDNRGMELIFRCASLNYVQSESDGWGQRVRQNRRGTTRVAEEKFSVRIVVVEGDLYGVLQTLVTCVCLSTEVVLSTFRV